MFGPLAAIALAVIGGAALGILPGALPRITGPLKTFAVVSASSVVFLHFLPHALESKGIWGVAVAALSYALVSGLERAGASSALQRKAHGKEAAHDPAGGLGLGLSYFALVLHRIADGAALAAAEGNPGVLWALGAHSIPVLALVTLAYRRRSLREALLRAGLLGVASALSFTALSALPSLLGGGFSGWVDAVACGVLMNVVVGELRGDLPQSRLQKSIDVLAAVAGASLVVSPLVSGAAPHDELLDLHRLLSQWLRLAPPLLCGLVVSAGIHGAERDSARPALSDALGPLGPARAELSPVAILLSVQLLGWPLSCLRLGGALLASAAGRLVVRPNAAEPRETPEGARSPDRAKAERGSLVSRALGGADAELLHNASPLALGLIAATCLESLLAPRALAELDWSSRLAVVISLAAANHLRPSFATPIAAALLHGGLPAGTVLTGLCLAAPAHALVRGAPGGNRLLWVSAAALVCVGLGQGVSPWSQALAEAARPGPALATWLSWFATLSLVALALRGTFASGVRDWLNAGAHARGTAPRSG